MFSLAGMLRRAAYAALCVAGVAGTAMAQSPPPGEPDANQPAEPMAEPEPQPAEPMAQPEPQEPQEAPQPTYQQNVTVIDEEPVEEQDTLERYGIAVGLGGGVSGFTNSTMRDFTNDGGGWNVRATFGTRYPIAFEGEYTGSAQSIDALGLDDDAVLVGNGLQGAVRVNILDQNIQPFVFGGVAWRHYELADEGINTSDVANSDDVLEIPVGAGVAWRYRGFMLDVRGEYRYARFEDMVPKFDDAGFIEEGGAAMNRYGAMANLGYAF